MIALELMTGIGVKMPVRMLNLRRNLTTNQCAIKTRSICLFRPCQVLSAEIVVRAHEAVSKGLPLGLVRLDEVDRLAKLSEIAIKRRLVESVFQK
jgi:hypothetical protein